MKKKDPAAVAMAKKRAKKLGPERTKQIASEAANSRWSKMSDEERKAAMEKVSAGRKYRQKDAGELPKGGRGKRITTTGKKS